MTFFRFLRINKESWAPIWDACHTAMLELALRAYKIASSDDKVSVVTPQAQFNGGSMRCFFIKRDLP